MSGISKIREYLQSYDGKDITIMEVCGSHTAAIAKSGIRGMLSPKIHLVSGPGCPVCVTPSAYIDRLIALAKKPETYVVTFGDLLRVPGSEESLQDAKVSGAKSMMVYSPMEVIKYAKEHPERMYIFAAIGFETTTPVYAFLLEMLEKEQITNVKILTALKVMPPVLSWLCENGAKIDGFIAPGHVAAVTGSQIFQPLADKYHVPFGVAGFEPEKLLAAIFGIVKMIEQSQVKVENYYKEVVDEEGNQIAKSKVDKYFMPSSATWRGIGKIESSGLVLREEYQCYDAGSKELDEDKKIHEACCCDRILLGKMTSKECPLYRTVCTPMNPKGACMVSMEGCCHQEYIHGLD